MCLPVQKERTGELVDRSLLKSMTTMLVDLGRSVYVDDFEAPFLERTAEFYQVCGAVGVAAVLCIWRKGGATCAWRTF